MSGSEGMQASGAAKRLCELEADHENKREGRFDHDREDANGNLEALFRQARRRSSLSKRGVGGNVVGNRSERLVSGNRCASHATLQHTLQFFSLS